MSIGQYAKKDRESPLYRALVRAYNAGIYIVASAGNDDRNAGSRLPYVSFPSLRFTLRSYDDWYHPNRIGTFE
jgi:subtilisin family serine protease